MAGKKFTNQHIQALRYRGERKDYWSPSSEGKGVLGVRVGPSSKAFIFSYRFGGKARRMTLGRYPKMTLAGANAAVREARKKLDRSEDPGRLEVEAHRQERAAESMAEVCAAFLKDPKTKAKRTYAEIKRMIDRDIVPELGKKKAKAITRRDVTRLLDGIVERGSPIMANRVRACAGRIFSWSVGKGIIDKSPVTGTERPAPERKRGRNLAAPEVKVLWEAIGASTMEDRVKRAMRLLLVTLQRRGEIAGMHEREINRERREWVIPAERAKNGLAHLVPLTDTALELIGPAPDPGELAKEPLLGYVFHKRLKNGVRGPFHADALTHAMRDLFHPRDRHKGKIAPLGIEECRPHDLRRTGTTLVREEGIPREYMRFVLNHKDRSVTSEHYDLSDNLGEKRVALQAWEGRLRRILAGDFKRTFREVVEQEKVAQLRVVA